jgi:hypothetical protein
MAGCSRVRSPESLAVGDCFDGCHRGPTLYCVVVDFIDISSFELVRVYELRGVVEARLSGLRTGQSRLKIKDPGVRAGSYILERDE